jgi:hypothetical protein
MNMLKKGPELKMPDLKVPDFLLDIYYDLRERHLLPLVAILLVALVALPVVLSKSSSTEAEEGSAAIATPSSVTPTSSLVVAKATPGLREYRRRLVKKTAQNPFKPQQVSSVESEGPEGPSSIEEVTLSGGPEETPASGGSEGGSSTIPPPEGNGEPPSGGHLEYYSWTIDVRITPVTSGKEKPESVVRRNQPEMSMLPSQSVPALTFIGVTKDEKKAVMLVSDKVTGLFGDSTCTVGSEACQLIALEPEIPETVVYGANSRTYRIELLKVHLTETDKLNTAPLGKSKKQKSDKGQEQEQRLDRDLLGPSSTAASR